MKKPLTRTMSFSHFPSWDVTVSDMTSGIYFYTIRKRYFRMTKTVTGTDVHEITADFQVIRFIGTGHDRDLTECRELIAESF